jgi:hypothetical protein
MNNKIQLVTFKIRWSLVNLTDEELMALASKRGHRFGLRVDPLLTAEFNRRRRFMTFK